MISTGVKTEASDREVTQKYVDEHLQIGIESLLELNNNGKSIKHLRFD